MALVLALCAPVAALAQGSADAAFQLRFGEGRSFDQLRDEVVKEMRDGGRFGEIGDEARAEVVAALDTMAELLDGRDSFGHLDEEEKIRLFNAQEIANTYLTVAREDSRMVCKRERKVGSHFKTSICHTVAEWTIQREAAHDAMSQKQRGPICTSGGACGPPAQGPPRG
jgi:hypothetical protein